MTQALDDSPRPATSASLVVEPGPIDPGVLAGRIAATLAAHGWAHVARAISDVEFEEVAGCLGTIDMRTDLVVDTGRADHQRQNLADDERGRPVVYQAEAMDFHTDRPTADILAWRCVEPDAQGGENQWLDLRDLDEAFSPEEADALARIEVGYVAIPHAVGLEVRQAPLVERSHRGLLVCYIPWRVRPMPDEAAARALDRFVAYVRAKQDRDLKTLRLERGECLFLDNRRMLHGRASLPPDSRRHLVRLYIRKAPRA